MRGTMKERAVVVMATEIEAELEPFSVTDEGLTVQVEAAGAPEQVKETAWLNPPSGLTTRLRFAAWPAFTLAELGEADREKSIPVPASETV
jgi:hypothetical protein